MPTNLPRTQVLLQPDTHAAMATLAKHNRRYNSAMCSELIEAALKLPKYRSQLEEAVIQVPPKEDTRVGVPQVAIRKEEREVPSYKEYLKQPKDEEVVENFGLDQLTPERISELQLLLKSLEAMKKQETA